MIGIFEELVGKVLSAIKVEREEDWHGAEDQIVFTLDSGEKYRLYHSQNCCEEVSIEEIIGDLKDLVGTPITLAEEIIHESDVNPDGVEIPEDQDSFTWTFYKLATINGYATIRWYGASNGYYSEEVDWEKIS